MANIKEKLYYNARLQRVPITGGFEVSPICNFQCKMCYVRKTREEVNKLGGMKSLDFWIKLARDACKEGLLYPLITGGEPFLYPCLKELYEEFTKLGCHISINTNGCLITEKEIQWLRKMPPVRLNITLYGASNKSYGDLCGDYHGFEKVEKAVQLLKEAGIRFRFNASITPQNKHELKEMVDFASKYGSVLNTATYMFPPVRRDENSFGKNDRLSADEAGYHRVLSSWYQRTPKEFIQYAKGFENFVPISKIDFNELSHMDGREMGCGAGRYSFWIDWQGNLSSCGMIDWPQYDLNEYSFKDAWNEIVKTINDTRYSPFCCNCPNRKICHTCIASVYNETGNIMKRPEYICLMNEAAAKYYKRFLEKIDERGILSDDEQEDINEKDFFDDINNIDDCDMY